MANDLEQRARELFALQLDEASHHTEADNVRRGIDLESYAVELRAVEAALQQAQQPGAQAVAIVGDDLYPGWVDDAPDLPPGTKLYAASPPLPLEPEPDLDERDPKSGELVAQWLFRNGFRELAAVVRAQLDMRAPRKAPPPLPEGVSEEDVEVAIAAYGRSAGFGDSPRRMRAALESYRARLAAKGASA